MSFEMIKKDIWNNWEILQFMRTLNTKTMWKKINTRGGVEKLRGSCTTHLNVAS